ncbi:hypothetical protein [Deinococcus radiophilus]|uniref:Uncharacterized protein n=1 Tax=Deinococcus radiophilus TaxID=32062 RepID=A0A3S0IB53_9DEIO|nr:hypothetical protein [Deinococcus radiophilus]RTR28668.1 hypothetical protein EJ104_04765 [Deinococcus radiophilus]UFA51091.1 hypothetical protein LMT64_04125 [Deinococcus radiophilus]
MQVLLALFALIVGGLYFTVGLRLGAVAITPTPMYGAKGTSQYGFRTAEQGNKVGVKGSCTAEKGSANFYMVDPKGQIQSSASCVPGQPWAINLMAGGAPGMYALRVEYKNFTGKIDITEQRAGGSY